MAADRSEELFRALKPKGFPDDFCKELTYRQLNTDYTATRMPGYLYRQSEPRIGDDVWEALEPLEKKLADAGVQYRQRQRKCESFVLIINRTCVIFIMFIMACAVMDIGLLWRVFDAVGCSRMKSAEGVAQETANLSGKRTEH